MHILVVPSWYPSNSEDVSGSFIREQAQALARYGGHRVGVVFPKFRPFRGMGTSAIGSRGIEVTLDEGVTTYRLNVLDWLRRIPYLGAEIWIRQGMRLFSRYMHANGKPDVIHAHVMFYGGLLAQRISAKYRIPFVVTEHDSGYARGFVKPWQLMLGSEAAKSASACIAVGEKFADMLDNVYKLKHGSWRYVPNMVSGRFFETPFIEAINSKKRGFRFCSICNLNSNKGVDLIIRAFAQIFSTHKSVQLIIGGEGSERLALEQLAKVVGVSEQVSFLGKLSRDQVVEVMTSSDALVLASHYETFGMVLVEALALGKPVVATRCGGPESIVKPDCGILVENGSINALAEGMKQLHEHISDYEAQQLRNTCMTSFSEIVVVQLLAALYACATSEQKQSSMENI